MSCKRIVFTGDFLRPSWDGKAPTQHYNIQWCRDLLGRQIAMATGLPVEMVVWDHAGVSADSLNRLAIEQIYKTAGVPLSIVSWAELYDASDLPTRVEQFFASLFRDALVVGFELPPYIESVLTRAGVPFVDVIIHPVRFLDDIFLGIRTSDPSASAVLARHAIAEEFIELMAGLQSAAARRGSSFAPPSGASLLLLQTRFDRTQIRDGKFIGALHFLDEITAIAEASSVLYVKEHPLEAGTNHAAAVRSAVRNVEMTNENVYRLMAHEKIQTVATLSSSTGIEARYFRKDGRFLYKEPNRFAVDGNQPEPDQFVGVFDAALSADFWRETLASVLPTSRQTGVRIPFKANRLRTSLRSFWSFNEIDTDFPVSLARTRNAA